MARPRVGTALFRAKVTGAGPVARDFDRAQRQLQDRLVRELRALSLRATDTVRFFAPEDSGDLKEQLDARFYFRAAEPRFTIVSPTEHNGYPYTAITRFGHRQARLRPRRAKVLTVHAPGRLAISWLAFSVRGVGHGTRHIPHDWVAEAMPFVNDEVGRAGARLGRAVTTEMLPGRRIR